MTEIKGHEFDRSIIDLLSGIKQEPDWMKIQRLECWNRFHELDYPDNKEESWRRTNPSRLIPNGHLNYYASPKSTLGPLPFIEQVLKLKIDHLIMQHGLYAQLDSEPVFAHISPTMNSHGIIFSSMEQAIRHYPELVQRYMFTRCRLINGNKFQALHGSIWSGGYFLYIPKGIKITIPLKAYFVMEKENLILSPHNIIVVEEGSDVTFIEEYGSSDLDKQSLVFGTTEVNVANDARFQLLTIHNWGNNVYEYFKKAVRIGKNSSIQWFSAILGSSLSKTEFSTELSEPGADARIQGLYVGDDRQHLDIYTDTYHGSPNTSADVLFKGAMTDRSRSVFQGLIRIPGHAQKTNSYMQNRNLMLSKNARADSIPKLEIIANDVKASHASATGTIDADQMYYLMSRGLSIKDAKKMIISGFFEQLIQQLNHPGLEERIRYFVNSKLASIHD